MSLKVIEIKPVTRIEGETRVIIFLDEEGKVKDAHYQVIEFRGFEAFCRGRHIEELPRIVTAICGVCSWAHHLASGKAIDMLYGRKPTTTANKLRELSYLAHIIDSHMLHYIALALPDFILDLKSPIERNIAGMLRKEPKIIKLFLRSRKLVKGIEETFGGKPIHPAFVLPGGVARKLSKDDWNKVSKYNIELMSIVSEILDHFKRNVLRSKIFEKLLYDETYSLKTYYMGLVDEKGNLNFYDGYLRIIDNKGREVAKFKADDYTKYIAEHFEEWSYSKFPYLKIVGWKGFNEEYICRVGPLARLNVADSIPSEQASEELKLMIETVGSKPIHNSLAYHWSRLIESLHACEKMQDMLHDEDIFKDDIINTSGTPTYDGVGIVEAPRGTLIHHYKANEEFLAEEVNIITPTAINNAAINTELKKVASKLIRGEKVNEEILNLVEISIRSYDPCNACATHYIDFAGNRNLSIIIYDSNGKMLKKLSYKNR